MTTGDHGLSFKVQINLIQIFILKRVQAFNCVFNFSGFGRLRLIHTYLHKIYGFVLLLGNIKWLPSYLKHTYILRFPQSL